MNFLVQMVIVLCWVPIQSDANSGSSGIAQEEKDPWVGKALMPKLGAQIETDGMKIIPFDEVDYPMFAKANKGQYLVLRSHDSPIVLKSQTIALEDAEKYYLKLINDGQDVDQARLFLAALKLHEKDYSGAISLCNVVLASEDRDGFAFLLRAQAISFDNFGTRASRIAMLDVEKYMAMNPSNANAIALKAKLLTDMNKDEEAEKLYDEAVKLRPKVGKYYEMRGTGFFRAGDHERAVEELLKAIELEPLNEKFPAVLAWMYAASGSSYKNTDKPIQDLEKAYEYATKACELSDWKNEDLIRMTISITSSLGKTDECRKLERILEELQK